MSSACSGASPGVNGAAGTTLMEGAAALLARWVRVGCSLTPGAMERLYGLGVLADVALRLAVIMYSVAPAGSTPLLVAAMCLALGTGECVAIEYASEADKADEQLPTENLGAGACVTAGG